MDVTEITRAVQEVDLLVWVAIAAALLLLVLAVTLMLVRRARRRRELRQRYGAEYDRTARRTGSRRQADQDLLAREEHRHSYAVRDLASGERERLRARWEALQASFVDRPETAVAGAEELLGEVAALKGYDTDGDDPLRDVSVDHPLAIDRYRVTRTSDPEGADTEAWRRALLGARELFEIMVGPEGTGADTPRSPFRDLINEDPRDGDTAVEPASRTDRGRAAEPAPRQDPDDQVTVERRGDGGTPPERRAGSGRRTTDRDADPREPDAPFASGGSEELPLYGPDGRPLNDESGRPRR